MILLYALVGNIWKSINNPDINPSDPPTGVTGFGTAPFGSSPFGS